MSELSWARFVDAGLTQIELLTDLDSLHERWVVRAPDGSALVVIDRGSLSLKATWHVYVYQPGARPPGGTSSMQSWLHEWERIYTDSARLLDDVAAIAG